MKFVNNIALKIFAVFISFVLFFGFVVSAVGVGFMMFGDFYTQTYKDTQNKILTDMAEEELGNLIYKYTWENDLEGYYSDKNVFYEITRSDGKFFTNRDGSDIIASASTAYAIDIYYDEFGNEYGESEVVYCSVDGEKGWYNFDDVPVTAYKQSVKFSIYIPDRMKYTDSFYVAKTLIFFGYENRYTMIFWVVISLVLCIVVYSYLLITVGHSRGDKVIYISAINNLPADLMTGAVAVIGIISTLLLFDTNAFITALLAFVLIAPVLYFVLLWYVMSIAVQIKARRLVKHTVIYFIIKKLGKVFSCFKFIYKNIPTAYKTVFVLAITTVIQLVFMGFNAFENDNLIIGWLLFEFVTVVALVLAAIAFGRLKTGGEKIANGDLDSKIDTQYMYGDIKDFAESLNNINNGLQVAINDKVKSERFKTELITNVSHDIKTPLTSIVNYVDLIKKENSENQKINEYIDVLDRQFSRFKKLIEDLVEASKASTGNISVELTKCNLSVLINQAVGEFSEKLERNNLTVVQSVESDEIYVLADGRRLWRVFDNLLNNICKYAMSGTRVYIDLFTDNKKAIITFKNISSSQLIVSGEDLTERFVRGDRSRNTEGSGLGLSIAKSLTVLQNGSFKIETDGDLFKAIITFDMIGK